MCMYFGFWLTLSYIRLQNLGVNLVWRSASEGITVSVDMTVTLFNKEQFAENRWVGTRKCYHSAVQISVVKGCVSEGAVLVHAIFATCIWRAGYVRTSLRHCPCNSCVRFRTFSLKRATFQSDHLQNGCSNFVQGILCKSLTIVF